MRLRRRHLQTLGLLALALAVVFHLGCPNCYDARISVTLQGSKEALEQVVAVEWSVGSGDFQPCLSLGSDYECRGDLPKGACGPDPNIFEYTVRALDADGNEVQDTIKVGRIECGLIDDTTLDVSALLVTP